jgi:hypothetical protein
MARLNKKLWEAWQNGYIYSIWATSRSAALRALKSKYGGKFTRIRQYPGIGKENPRRVNGKKKKSIKKRITRALKKFVRANPKRRMYRGFHLYWAQGMWSAYDAHGTEFGPTSSIEDIKYEIDQYYDQYLGGNIRNPNPRRVKGAKCNGGRSVSLRNFTGRVIKKRDGTVQILGRTRKTK